MKKVILALDQPRELKFSINAMVDLEARFGGTPLPELVGSGKVGYTVTLAILRVGLVEGGMRLKGTVKEQERALGEIIQEHWLEEGRKLQELIDAALESLQNAGILDRPETQEEQSDVNPNSDTAEES